MEWGQNHCSNWLVATNQTHRVSSAELPLTSPCCQLKAVVTELILLKFHLSPWHLWDPSQSCSCLFWFSISWGCLCLLDFPSVPALTDEDGSVGYQLPHTRGVSHCSLLSAEALLPSDRGGSVGGFATHAFLHAAGPRQVGRKRVSTSAWL